MYWLFMFLCHVLVSLGFPRGSAGKESACNMGDLDCIVHGVAKSWTRLSDFHFHFHYWCYQGVAINHASAQFFDVNNSVFSLTGSIMET